MLRASVRLGAVLLVVMGFAHGLHVARADNVEPYLWAASAALVIQGILTLVHLRRKGRR
jgi:hypothetical protein